MVASLILTAMGASSVVPLDRELHLKCKTGLAMMGWMAMWSHGTITKLRGGQLGGKIWMDAISGLDILCQKGAKLSEGLVMRLQPERRIAMCLAVAMQLRSVQLGF